MQQQSQDARGIWIQILELHQAQDQHDLLHNIISHMVWCDAYKGITEKKTDILILVAEVSSVPLFYYR